MGCNNSKIKDDDELSIYNSIIDDFQSIKSNDKSSKSIISNNKSKSKSKNSILLKNNHLVMMKGSTRTIKHTTISGRDKTNTTTLSADFSGRVDDVLAPTPLPDLLNLNSDQPNSPLILSPLSQELSSINDYKSTDKSTDKSDVFFRVKREDINNDIMMDNSVNDNIMKELESSTINEIKKVNSDSDIDQKLFLRLDKIN